MTEEPFARLHQIVEDKRQEHRRTVSEIQALCNTSQKMRDEAAEWHVRWIDACNWFDSVLKLLDQAAPTPSDDALLKGDEKI